MPRVAHDSTSTPRVADDAAAANQPRVARAKWLTGAAREMVKWLCCWVGLCLYLLRFSSVVQQRHISPWAVPAHPNEARCSPVLSSQIAQNIMGHTADSPGFTMSSPDPGGVSGPMLLLMHGPIDIWAVIGLKASVVPFGWVVWGVIGLQVNSSPITAHLEGCEICHIFFSNSSKIRSPKLAHTLSSP